MKSHSKFIRISVWCCSLVTRGTNGVGNPNLVGKVNSEARSRASKLQLSRHAPLPCIGQTKRHVLKITRACDAKVISGLR